MEFFVTPALGYLLGSIPTSVLVGRWLRGVDIREHGSGNAGASNVLRVLGWRPAVVVLAIDIGKGTLAVLLVPYAVRAAGGEADLYIGALAGMAAVLGHLWPVWTGFRGGKGVATAAGAMGALHPLVMVVAVPLFFVALSSTRRIAVGSMAAALSLPIATYGLDRVALIEATPATLLFAGAIALLTPWTHRSNIRRLWAGTEARIGDREG